MSSSDSHYDGGCRSNLDRPFLVLGSTGNATPSRSRSARLLHVGQVVEAGRKPDQLDRASPTWRRRNRSASLTNNTKATAAALDKRRRQCRHRVRLPLSQPGTPASFSPPRQHSRAQPPLDSIPIGSISRPRPWCAPRPRFARGPAPPRAATRAQSVAPPIRPRPPSLVDAHRCRHRPRRRHNPSPWPNIEQVSTQPPHARERTTIVPLNLVPINSAPRSASPSRRKNPHAVSGSSDESFSLLTQARRRGPGAGRCRPGRGRRRSSRPTPPWVNQPEGRGSRPRAVRLYGRDRPDRVRADGLEATTRLRSQITLKQGLVGPHLVTLRMGEGCSPWRGRARGRVCR